MLEQNQGNYFEGNGCYRASLCLASLSNTGKQIAENNTYQLFSHHKRNWREVGDSSQSFSYDTLQGYRQNEVEILPSWFIYRKEEISLVKAVANKKGFRR